MTKLLSDEELLDEARAIVYELHQCKESEDCWCERAIGDSPMRIVDLINTQKRLYAESVKESIYDYLTPEVECPHCFTVTNFNIPSNAPDDGFDVTCGWCQNRFWAIPNVSKYFSTNSNTKKFLTNNIDELRAEQRARIK